MSPGPASGKTEHIFQMGAPQYVLLIYIYIFVCMHICIYMASHTDQYRQKTHHHAL